MSAVKERFFSPSDEERMLVENSGLIWSVVRRYYGRGVDPDDLYQLGCIGFIKALRDFDPDFGTRFSTYAVPKIAGEIRRFLRDDGAIKVSRSVKEHAFKVARAKAELEQRLGREPVLSELSAETGITPEEIAVCETASAPVDSLQRETGNDGDSPALENMLADFSQEDKLLEYVALRQAVDSLPEKERAVIGLRFWRGMTQSAAAKVLGVSQVQVSRLERKSFEFLRKALDS
ncbi:MAG: sigma-70 family RNA polymerase sigma factor [Oscillospiraceae bacterium]|jgi:RNA polymerase sporulation-specific sigma factor|nr:sigma-70 family RNA polymerase sigma factor [Oscillospiraceae bacterium]